MFERHFQRRPGGRPRALTAAVVAAVCASGLVTAGGSIASASPTPAVETAAVSLGKATVLDTLSGAPFASTAPQTSIPFALGYWKSLGLSVTSNELGSTSTDAEALSLIAAHPNQLQTAPVAPSSLMTAVSKGLPVIGVYVYMREGLNSIYVLNSSPITKMSQLDGKTIGTYAPPPGGPYDEAKFMIESNGGNPSSVSIVNIGYSPATVQQLKKGNAAAYVVTEPDYFTAQGVDLRQLPDSTFKKRFGFVFAVSTAELKNNPKGVAALMKGFAEATLFAETNRSAALEVHWKLYPDSKPTGVSNTVALQQGLLSISHRFDKYTVPTGQEYGELPTQTASWNSMEQEAMLGGTITSHIPVAKLFDGSLISSINQFPKASVMATAKAYTG